MPYVAPEVVQRVKQIDLLTYVIQKSQNLRIIISLELLEQSIDIDESVLYDENINTHPSIAKHSTQLSLAVKYSVRYFFCFYAQKVEHIRTCIYNSPMQ